MQHSCSRSRDESLPSKEVGIVLFSSRDAECPGPWSPLKRSVGKKTEQLTAKVALLDHFSVRICAALL